ncbi:DUF3566 domain-containing protein [Pseudarthrobacter sp. J75]|uniref:DUF3566 domain-containing protein n=1 Tax=unclassified Pseudarthrobacter TaxID=2647000 RepID=UPI002E815E7B|nr:MULTISPECIES: DUF3566 domain-containing protein [unclassified Pseudarthrobacter]MEE2523736.1 DUF3566 domain-containing protein [Pseudarthrobacter sp. J47]MEE2529902.1 DUF3566 domain-containing protein [Pseudarthrobacter sp. J75]MEE2570076.1 DUF3566 domain-containing protein [Pseudarthrobacter sp. J64]
MSNSDSFPKTGSNTPGPAGRPAQAPRVNAPARPPQQPAAAPRQSAPAGQRPPQGSPAAGARPATRPVAGQRPGQPAGQRPLQGTQGTPGLVKPAPKAKVRRARLLVSKVDPWSVLKMSFLLSVALGIVTVVAAIVLWTVLDLTGIFDQVDSLLGTLSGTEGGGFELKKFASLGQVASFATIIAVVNVVLLTALSMLSAVLYNISATLVGGIGVTLTDD